MFRDLARAIAAGPINVAAANAVLTTYRPSQLSEYLEAAWNAGRTAQRQQALGGPAPIGAQAMARQAIIDPLGAAGANPLLALGVLVEFPHLCYAYLIECTRIVEIFRRVVFEWLHGERLPRPNQATHRWLHVTEQLFFAASWPYSVHSVTSSIRPDFGAVRRNAYWRMFSWELAHLAEDGRPYPYVKSEATNRDFTSTFEGFLAESWRTVTNLTNIAGANDSDPIAIGEMIRRLQQMLLSRRYQGLLAREEFLAGALLSWLHLTVEEDTDVVVSLNAQGGGAADRLKKIGELVGLPAHARSDSYFQMAEPMSNLLLVIENNQAAPAVPGLFAGGMLWNLQQVITHWSITTGRNIKDPTARRPINEVMLASPRPQVVTSVSAIR